MPWPPTDLRFKYSQYPTLPETPYVDDVLIELGQLDSERGGIQHLSSTAANRNYMENVRMITKQVQPWAIGLGLIDQQQLIAFYIVQMTPLEMQTSDNDAYRTAVRMLPKEHRR